MEATDALGAGAPGGGLTGAEVDRCCVAARGVLLDGGGAAGCEMEVGVVAGLNVVLRPAKELAHVLVWRPCTSRSALQARWNK